MVKVQIPFDLPTGKGKGKGDGGSGEERGDDDDEDEVGIMSDVSEESDMDDDIADTDWEEVARKEADADNFSFKPGNMLNLPENGITITLTQPKRTGKGAKSKSKKRRRVANGGSGEEDDDDDDDAEEEEDSFVKRRKKRMDLNEIVRKSVNRVKIAEQLMKHKFSLLMYLARGLRLVKIINCNVIRGLSMSVVDNRFEVGKMKGKKSDRKLLELFMQQFEKVFKVVDDDDDDDLKRAKHTSQPFMLSLLDCYASLETCNLIECVVVFVACLRALRPNLPMRIVNVLRPITMRADIIPKPSENGEPAQAPKPKQPEEIIEKLDYWLEVFLEDEKKWCCLDLCNLKLDEPNVLTELSRPFFYLVSYDLDRSCVKPAEKNYCDNWYTPGFRKGRCEDKWWDKVMSALGPSEVGEKDKADETKKDEMLVKQDMPQSDSGFRNHPLYVLEKHLLKFQAIYPSEVAPMGFFKDQPVYPRDCVHIVRSRETWLREARTVRLGETAYKIVKARPKRDKYTGELVRDLPLELFGEWQTKEYEPPTAEDGIVPRNAYGNVDMYKECMLPKKCAWLKLPGLPRVASKLKIDCAAAVVGFDNHCGGYGAHPVIDGFVVCEEFAETLTMAWEEEQVNIRKRELEKRQKRVWDNWRRLLRAAMIRERLRVKYKNS